ncbi:MAG: hypothetical protein QOC96_2363 [Acidobacteriota bacterium]|jgi:predicted component of type VI protein secretion system|nr:hypothetical protein [Acidobacteriota bacterium]
MKIAKTSIAVCLLLCFASCARESSEPQKAIIGSWKATDSSSISLAFGPDGTFLMSASYRAPSDFDTGTYTLNTDPPVNTLTLNFHGHGSLSFQPDRTVTYEVKVYDNELVLGVGQGKMSLKRVSK